MMRWKFILCFTLFGCAKSATEVAQFRTLPTPEALEKTCETVDVAPAVTQVAENVWMARGYDLANTYLIATSEGNVIIDAASCPDRAAPQKAALLAAAPGPIVALIYTHSHLDHVGGASVMADEGTQIWATDALFPHLMKQYGVFRETESRRAGRQWGLHVGHEEMACSSIGKRLDLIAASDVGILRPTHTFSGQHQLNFGETEIHLVEAHGETHDQLFVWLPQLEVLFPGDNYYSAFPNLYTVRGTSPRPVDQWIQSLDEMRVRDPKVLLPSHTAPVLGKTKIRAVLTDYRDAIQWTRDHVVRGANKGLHLPEIVAGAGLPEHLASQPYLKEMYGQTDWSVRAIYGNELGWFDGRAELLYAPEDASRREIEMMGGPTVVLAQAKRALDNDDAAWAAYLVGKVRDSDMLESEAYSSLLYSALKKAGTERYNTNGRAYLLEAAHEVKNGWVSLPEPQVNARFLGDIPIEVFFDSVVARLIPESSMDVHQTVQFVFPDLDVVLFLTIRRGVAEYRLDTPLPGTPEPLAVVRVDSLTWKRLALGLEGPTAAVLSGRLKVKSLGAFQRFMNHFRQ